MSHELDIDLNSLEDNFSTDLDFDFDNSVLGDPSVGTYSTLSLDDINAYDSISINGLDQSWLPASPISQITDPIAEQSQFPGAIGPTYAAMEPFETMLSNQAIIEGTTSQPPMNQPTGINQFRMDPPQMKPVRSNSAYSTSELSVPRHKNRYFRGGGGILHPQRFPSIAMFSPSVDVAERSYHPLQRWRESSPDEEPASLLSIRNALEAVADERQGPMSGASSTSISDSSLRAMFRRRGHRARSTISCSSNNSISSRPSSISSRSVMSCESVRIPGSNLSRRSRPKTSKRSELVEAESRFHCTFCRDTFKRKYDWARHEKSLHLNLSGWRCAPFGGTVLSPLAKRMVCAYCNALDPTPEHIDGHNHQVCQTEAGRAKVFLRKDHLMQHLRVTHRLDVMPLTDDWKLETPAIRSRCGFCDARMATWDERANHLAAHFHQNLTMDSWRGDHGFDPDIAAQIQNTHPSDLLAAQPKP